jgi:hypothetical protein
MSDFKEGHRGNPRLATAEQKVALTAAQRAEYVKCFSDPIYFMSKYMKVVSLANKKTGQKGGLQPFILRDYQEKLVNTFQDNRYIIAKMPRQVGKSVTTIGFLLHCIVFNEFKIYGILAHKGSASRKLLGQLKLAYEHLPKWMQSGVLEWNKGSISLANGCQVLAEATSSSSVRGWTFDMVILDEFAMVEPNVAEEFYTSTYPTLTSGDDSKVIILSTPKGIGNLFHKLWVDSENKQNDYVNFAINWWDVPGRDEEWKLQEIRNTSQRKFNQEHGCEFLGSDNTLISGEKLRLLTWQKPINENEEGVKIFIYPQADHAYAMTVDVSRGLEGDYSAFIVFDVSTIPYQIVATYRSNEIDPIVFPAKIARIGQIYNDAFVLVEINDNGSQVADLLHYDLEYPNMFIAQVKQTLKTQTIGGGHARRFQFGLKQSTTTKRIGCSNLKTLVEKDKVLIPDHEIVKELATFVADGPTFKAAPGNHDDLAMCLVMFGWLSAQRYFREQTRTDIFLNMRNLDITDQSVSAAPVGIMDESMNTLAKNKGMPFGGKVVHFDSTDVWFDVTDSPIDNPIYKQPG